MSRFWIYSWMFRLKIDLEKNQQSSTLKRYSQCMSNKTCKRQTYRLRVAFGLLMLFASGYLNWKCMWEKDFFRLLGVNDMICGPGVGQCIARCGSNLHKRAFRYGELCVLRQDTIVTICSTPGVAKMFILDLHRCAVTPPPPHDPADNYVLRWPVGIKQWLTVLPSASPRFVLEVDGVLLEDCVGAEVYASRPLEVYKALVYIEDSNILTLVTQS